MKTREAAIGALLLQTLVPLSQSGEPQRPPTFRAGIEVIGLSLSVTDGRNRLITGLSEPDFAVFEDGMRQDLSRRRIVVRTPLHEDLRIRHKLGYYAARG